MLGYLNARDVKTVEVLHECVNFRPPPPMPNRPGVGGLRLIGPIRLDMASELRCAACVVLWRAEKKVNSVAPTLLEMLGSRWNGDQTSAIGAIAAIGPDLKEAVGPALMKLMYSDVRGEIYTLIPTFAPTKRIAAEELTKALLDECAYYTKFVEDYHAGRTQMTLEQFAFAHRFGYGEVNAAKNALVTLGDAAIPELITLLRRSDRSDARGAALNILRLMKIAKKGDVALKAIGEVEKLLNDPDPSVKSLAETTLKELKAK